MDLADKNDIYRNLKSQIVAETPEEYDKAIKKICEELEL